MVDEVVSGEHAVDIKPNNDFVISGEEPAPEVKPEPIKEEVAPEPVAEDEPEDDDIDDQPSEPEKKPKRGGYQRRIARLEAEIAALKARPDDAPSIAPIPAQQQDAPPRQEDFETWEEYQDAKTDWKVEQRLKAEKQEAIKQTKAERYKAAVSEFKATVPDFDDVVNNYDGPFTEDMAVALLESPVGAKVSYYIASNPEIGHKLATLDKLSLGREIGRIEAKLEYEESSKNHSGKSNTSPCPD